MIDLSAPSSPCFTSPQLLIRIADSPRRLLLQHPQLLIWDKLSVSVFCRVVDLSVMANKYFLLALHDKDSRLPPPALIITPSTLDMGQALRLGLL